MTQYFTEAQNMTNKWLNSDTFANHFVTQGKERVTTTTKHIRDSTTVGLLWQGNDISSCKLHSLYARKTRNSKSNEITTTTNNQTKQRAIQNM